MSPVDPEDSQTARAYGASYFKLSAIEPGGQAKVKIVEINKKMGAKYPLKGKEYCYRAMLEDGRVWDINSWATFAQVNRAVEVNGEFTPTEIIVRRKASFKTKESPYEIVRA